MKINIKANADFERAVKALEDKYGEEMTRLNGFLPHQLDHTEFINNFIDTDTVADVSIDGNANVNSKDITTLMADKGKSQDKLLAFNKIFYELKKKYGLETAEQWLEQEWTGGFYLHNAPTSTFKPYCYAYDLDQVVERGLFFIDKFKAGPAKHLTTYNEHVLEFVSWAANRSSGAVGLPAYFVYHYYFWKHDVENGFYLKNPEYYRRQSFQEIVYKLNQPYVRIVECAFTNVSIMDRNYLTELFGDRVYPDGTSVIDYIDQIIEHQKVFMETLAEIRREMYMTFPVVTYALLYKDGKFVDEPFARWCNRHNLEWYDANFYIGNDVSVLSNCCRLLSDTTKLKGFINSIGGTSLQIGSVQVNTINLRRVALEAGGDQEKFKSILKNRLDLCIKVLDTVRRIIRRNVEKGLLPNYTYGLMRMEKQYCTIGITAMYEAMREFGLIQTDAFGNKSYSDEAMTFAREIFGVINDTKDAFECDYSFNVEAVPAERANVVLCEKDIELYGNEFGDFIYSNQWIPLMEKCTLNEKIRLGAELDKECGGGQISHINIEGRFANEEQAWVLLNHMAACGVIYFAYNTRTSVCPAGHGFFGEVCPVCGQNKSDEYSRVVGFLTPVSSYSAPRKKEFKKRGWKRVDQGFDGRELSRL